MFECVIMHMLLCSCRDASRAAAMITYVEVTFGKAGLYF